MRPVSAALLSALLALPLSGCTTGPASDDAAANADGDIAREEAFRIDGVVVVERLRAGDTAQTSVSAKFMRHATASAGGSPEAAERLVGTRLMLPPAGECASVALLEEADAEDAANNASFEGDVELVDVGDVALVTDLSFAGQSASLPRRGPGATTSAFGLRSWHPWFDAASPPDPSRSIVRLAPRAFPDVGDLVSGVFYTSPDAAVLLPAPAHYAIESSGAVAVDKFVLHADAPAEPADVRVAGVLLGDGTSSSPKPLARRGADLLVTWGRDASLGPSLAALPGDRVYIDVQAEAGAVHRCTFDDTGEALLPGAIVDGKTIAVAVHRLREASMPMPEGAMPDGDGSPDEAGRALVRFDLAVVGRVDVR